MPTVVIRNLDETLHSDLKGQAAAHGRSMEEEARLLLQQGVASAAVTEPVGWVDAIRALFEPLGGLDMPAIEREPPREPPDLQDDGDATATTV